MPQETNLNVSPYFDDFDADKDYYKVLFKPGYPIQARELTTLQSILQNQVEQYGKHIFKEGSLVIPGQIKYESPFYAVEIESEYSGVPISLYFDQLLGKKIKGSNSAVTAEIVYLLKNTESERGNYTLYLKYIQGGGEDFTNKRFQDGETLILQTSLTYGNFTIQVGQGVCNTITTNAISEGSAVSISEGVYFVRGVFARVGSQTIILDQYDRNPSYRVGFDVIERIVTAYDDGTLFDNAQGFSNYAAPGADRFRIELELSKRTIDETDTENFVEILRVENGVLQTFNVNSQYNLIRDELARRTSETSGDYFVKPFSLAIRDSLNDRVLNQGIFFKDQLTVSGNTPSDDLMVYEIGPGKAYVSGYDVETISSRLLDVPKARTTGSVDSRVLSLNAGVLSIVNNVYGAPRIGIGTTNTVKLMDSRIGSTAYQATGTEIGSARVYDFVPESSYIDDTSRHFLRLFDIETYTSVTLTQNITLSTPAVIKGKRSKASGYLTSGVSNSKTLTLYGVSGNFLENEPISINEIDNTRLITSVTDYKISDVKSVYSQVGVSTFNADVVFDTRSYIAAPGTTFNINGGVVSAGIDKNFTKILKVGDIVSYASTTYTGDPIYNKVSAVGTSGTTFTLTGITTVSGVCDGKLAGGSFNVTNIFKVYSNFSSVDSSLLTILDKKNVSSVRISETEILQRRLFSSQSVSSSGSIVITIDASDTDVYFEPFDEDRYVITYSDGTIEKLRSDKFVRNGTAKTVTFNGLSKTSGTADVIATVVNRSPDSKNKKLNKASSLIVSNSKLSSSGIGTTTINDGLTYSNVYGTRVQDEEICLNLPDIVRVLAVYESTGTGDPSLPNLQLTSFTGPTNSYQDYNIGEKITGSSSGAVGLVVGRKDTDKLEYVYLNTLVFQIGEVIQGEDSKTNSIIANKTVGDKNITQNFLLDDGQRDHFYDYGRIVRKAGVLEPSRRLKIIFQNYTINSGDPGEFVTANSYPSDGFKYDIPSFKGVRLTDTVDIRPRVAPYTLSTKSPFEFSSRNFASDGQYSKYTICPGEDLKLGYSYYQGRIDLINLNPDGAFEVIQGIPADNPTPPQKRPNSLDIAYTYIPPYVFDTKNVKYEMMEHRRYRMSDIGLLEDRIDRVEKYTTLSMLESKTENFIIRDAETGLDRFKCGFFADNFSSHTYHDVRNTSFRAAIDQTTNTLRPSHYTTSLDLQLGSEAISGVTNTYSPNADQNFVSDLGSIGVKKTGDLITLNYNEVLYFEQKYGTKAESVTPFLVRFWQGLVELRPPIDTWIEERTDTTNSFNEVTTTADVLPDVNITKVNNVTVNREVFVNNPTPQTGVVSDSFDWIGNVKTYLNKFRLSYAEWFKTDAAQKRTKDFWPSFFRDVQKGINTVEINGNTIHIDVLRSTLNTSPGLSDIAFSTIRSLLPADVATQFINQINTKSSNNRVLLDFTPGQNPVFKEETQTSTSTTTQSVSNTVTTIIPPEITQTTSTSQTSTTSQETIRFLRSRNIEFDVKGLRPITRFYSFFQGVDVQNYITPKLLEIQMISGRFEIGETVESSPTFTTSKIKFRLCRPDHKFGPFNAPTETFKYIPYNQQTPPTSYTASSTFLNVDTNALQLPSEVNYYGLASVGMTLIGKSSGAVARVSNIRLVSDNVGRLLGSLYIPDPTVSSNPKWTNGENTFTIIDTPTLSPSAAPNYIPGSVTNESTGEIEFISSGTRNITNVNILTTRNVRIIPARNVNTTTITNTTTNLTTTTRAQTQTNARVWETHDPLAQSFYVQDESGIFLTSVEVFFETKDDELPVTLQIRPMLGGVPSNVVVPFSEVTLTSDQVNLSANGSVATKFTFPSPVYLNGPKQQEVRQSPIGSQQTSEYSIVLLSGSPNYRVFIAELGKNDLIETNVKISQQPTLGSLFKSQNGTVWTPSQLEDLKYKIYRADFVQEGLVRFFNPKLSNKNKKVTVTGENQFVTLSKKIIVGLGSTGYNPNTIVPGVTIVQGSATGTLTGIAGSISVGSGVTISKTGTGYTGSGTFTNVNLVTETGYGVGAAASITIDSSTTGIGTVYITNGGTGYQVGDSLIVPELGTGVGYGGKVTVTSIGSSNSFVLDNVQGNFAVGVTTLNYITSSGIGSTVGAGVTISSITPDQYYNGNHMKIYHMNHGMHSSENYVKISKFRPEVTSTNSRLSSSLATSDISISISSGTGVGFTQFEGTTVSTGNPGYVIIGEEVIGYTGVSGDTLTSSASLRGVDGTEVQPYDSGTILYKYELQGVSLRRINKVHNLSLVDQTTHPVDLNSYHVKVEMGSTDYEGTGIGSDRSSDLYFRTTTQTGNAGTNITNNIQYEVLTPQIANIVLPKTSITPKIRTFTGTSIGGNEKSFVDAGFEQISLNAPYFFETPRLICSDVNESRFIDEAPGNRSLTMELLMRSEDSRVSPVVDSIQTSVILTSNLINNPVGINSDQGYANDDSVRSLTKDKHSTVYLSKPIKLKLAANSIKVILSASITNESDIRVLYQTFRNDSPNSGESFDLFPGWSNYQVDGQKIKRVVDFSQNNGSPDSRVIKTSDGSFKDYEFSVDDLADFDAFAIKIVMSSTNQANPPLIKDLRAIATVKPRG